MAKILVTGANGQLGNEIRRLCRNFPGLEFIFTDVDMLDITNPDAVSVFMEASKPAIVVNCAAYTNVDGAEVNVKNVEFVENLETEVELDTKITKELQKEGNVRDFVRAVQELRKDGNLKPSDAVEILVETDDNRKVVKIEKLYGELVN